MHRIFAFKERDITRKDTSNGRGLEDQHPTTPEVGSQGEPIMDTEVRLVTGRVSVAPRPPTTAPHAWRPVRRGSAPLT